MVRLCQFGQATERCSNQETCRGILAQRISSNLFLDELVVGCVRVESRDTVVAIWPGVGSLGVNFEAVRIRIANDIEPVLSPAFTVAWRRQQTFDHFSIRQFLQ